MMNLTKRWLLSDSVHYWAGHHLLSRWNLQFRFFWHRLFPSSKDSLAQVSNKVVRLSVQSTPSRFAFYRRQTWSYRFTNRCANTCLWTRPWTAYAKNGIFTGMALTGIQLSSDKQEEEWRWQRFRRAVKHLDDDWQGQGECCQQSHEWSQMDLDQIQIGSYLDKGCNSAVYEVALKSNDSQPSSPAIIQPSLALKILFNFDVESNGQAIFETMHKECVPFVGTFGKNLQSIDANRYLRLNRSHPNVVKVLSIFADQLPPLPDSGVHFEAALPKRLNCDGFGRNMTLFMLMKKYDTNLENFLATHSFHSSRSQFLLAQLFAGISFLNQNQIAHRDLKANNLLIDLEQYGSDYPWLVISDFGACCRPLVLHYSSDQVCKGGNRSLMAPEVVNARPSAFTFIDYSASDVWAAATIGYEIFAHPNPFYNRSGDQQQKALNSAKYSPDDLAPAERMPVPLQKMITQLLSIDPQCRPTASQAFVVCILSMLFDRKLIKLIAASVDRQKPIQSLHCIRHLLTMDFVRTSKEFSFMPAALLKLKLLFISDVKEVDIVRALKYF